MGPDLDPHFARAWSEYTGGLAPVAGVDHWLPTDVVEAYDPVTDTWSTGPSMLVARSQGGSAWAGGKFYTLGGVEDLPTGLSDRVEALSTSY